MPGKICIGSMDILINSFVVSSTYTLIWIQYDMKCYFNVQSKADTSRLNLPHGTDNLSGKQKN